MKGAFICPKCHTVNKCDCDACKDDIKEGDFINKWTDDGESLICASCGNIYNPNESLEEEFKIKTMGADNTFGETNFNLTKKYFAKYLPVEGEIKDGGKFWNKQHQVACNVSGELHVAVLKHGNFQAAKLFLCSRHIEKGDLVYYDDVLNYNPSYKGEIAKESGEHIKCFKVIGEISPDATWVKEGNEFDENEVDIFDLYEMSPKEKGELYDSDKSEYFKRKEENDWLVRRKYFKWSTDVPEKKGSFAYIKGPCGHFH